MAYLEITSCCVLAKNLRETQIGLVSLECSPNLIVNHLMIYTPLASLALAHCTRFIPVLALGTEGTLCRSILVFSMS